MFSKRQLLLLGLVAIASLAGLFYALYQRQHPRFDWNDAWSRQAYRETSDEPYGTSISHRLLEHYFPGKSLKDLKKNVGKELPADSSIHGAYVFVGEAMYLDSQSISALLRFVSVGNTALISSKTIPSDLMLHFYPGGCTEKEWNDYADFDTTYVSVRLVPPAPDTPTSLHYARQNRPTDYTWHYIEPTFFCDSQSHRPIGFLNDSLVNFASFPYGKGVFLLHTTPLAFSNYNLLRPETRSYAEGLLSWLPEGDLYWDAASRIPEQVGRRRNMSERRKLEDEHLLTYILQQPALAWTWYILFAMAALWLLFHARRRQRIIPVLPRVENDSYEFIATIANLHFRERNYRGLGKESMKLFLAQLRERYNLFVPLDPQTELPKINETFMEQLALVSEIPETQVRKLFAQYSRLIQEPATEKGMVDLHLAMEHFFKHAR